MADIDRLEIEIEANASRAAQNLDALTKSISGLGTALKSVGAGNLTNVSHLTEALATLSTNASNITVLKDNLSQLSTTMSMFMSAMANAPAVSSETIQMTQALAQLSAQANNMIAASGQLTNLGNALSQFMTIMSQAPTVANNTIQMTQATAQLVASIQSLNGTQVTANATTTSFTSGTLNLKAAFDKLNPSLTTITSSLMRMYSTVLILKRVFDKLFSTVKSAASYGETYSYFAQSMKQIKNNATGDWEELGYESADAYYESFAEEIKTLSTKMSGYTFTDTGNLQKTDLSSLGLNITTLLNYQTQFAQIASSMGVASETAVTLSNALTMLGGDLSSVKNMDFSDVWSNMQSGLVGMSRAVDKYGANIRVANLDTTLAKLGIDATASSLSQADKAILRTYVLVDSSRYAWGDLAKTLDRPANQLRVLTNSLSNAGRAIGNIFMPMVAAVLPYLIEMANAVERLANYIVKLFGWEDFDWGAAAASTDTDILSDIYDEADDAADAVDDVTDSLADMKSYLLGIDELNVIEPDTDSSTSSSDVDAAAATTAALTAALQSLLDEYEAVWNEAFANLATNYTNFADQIAKAFKQGGLYGVGAWISKQLSAQLKKIDWDSIYAKARTFGTGLANFLNGLITPDLFGSIGTTIAGYLNTKLYAALSFAETFDWTKLGVSLGTGINNFFATYDFAAWGTNISTWVIGILDTIIAFIDTTNWTLVGTQIGTALANIQWGTILKKSLQIVGKTFSATMQTIFASSDVASFSTFLITTTALITAFKKLMKLDVAKWFKKISTQVTSLGKTAFPNATSAMSAFKSLFNGNFLSNLKTGINNVSSSLSGIQKTGLAAVGVLSSLTLTKSGVSELASAIGGDSDASVLGSLASVAGGVATTMGTFTMAFGVPAGVIAGALVSLGGVILGLNDYFAQVEAEKYGQSIHDALAVPGGVTLDELSENYATALSTIGDSFDTLNDYDFEGAKTEISNYETSISGLVTAWEQGVTLSNTQMEQMVSDVSTMISTIQNLLNESYSDLYIALAGPYGEALEALGYDAEEYISVVATIQASGDEYYAELSKQAAELQTQLENGEISQDEFAEKYLEIYEKISDYTGADEIAQSYSDLQSAIDEIDISSFINEDGTLDIESLKEKVNDVTGAYEASSDAIHNYYVGLEEDWNNIISRAEAGEYVDPETLANAIFGLENIDEAEAYSQGQLDDIFNSYASTLNTGLAETIPSVIEKWQSEGKTTEEIKSKLSKWNDTLEEADEEIGKTLKSFGADWSDTSNIGETIMSNIFSYDNWVGQGQYAHKKAEFADNYKDTIESIINVALNKVDVSSSESTGNNILGGLNKGLQDPISIAQIKTSGVAAGEAATDSVDSGADTHSPSKTTEETGKNVLQGLINGIRDVSKLTTLKNISSIIPQNYIFKPFDDYDLPSLFENIGINTMKGLISGINSYTATLRSTMQKVANIVQDTVTTSLDIHSPSKVFENLGIFTMQGFQKGLEAFYQPIKKSLAEFGDEITLAATPTIEDMYGSTQKSINTDNLVGNINSEYSVDKTDYTSSINNTNKLLLQVIDAINSNREVSVTIDGKELVKAYDTNKKRVGYSFT